jgi:hypothetical protein
MSGLAVSTRTLLRDGAPRADRSVQRVGRSNAQPDFADPTEKCLQGDANLRIEIAAEKFHTKWVEGLDVLIEPVLGEVIITINHIHHHGAPGHNVAVLALFVEADEAANDIGTESRRTRAG